MLPGRDIGIKGFLRLEKNLQGHQIQSVDIDIISFFPPFSHTPIQHKTDVFLKTPSGLTPGISLLWILG